METGRFMLVYLFKFIYTSHYSQMYLLLMSSTAIDIFNILAKQFYSQIPIMAIGHNTYTAAPLLRAAPKPPAR